MMSKPLFEGSLRYCIRCCIPETEDGATFDELGICQACRSSEEKMHLNWVERERELRRILEEAKSKAGDNYDCIVPISGGKDSTFQLHVLCKVYGMKPLAVTFNHNWYSETGWYNLINSLETFNVDHVMFTPNRDLVNRLAKRSLSVIGDTCWHCHSGCGAFPYQVARRFKIPLLVYGEPSAEGHNLGSYSRPIEYDKHYFTKVSAKKQPDEMVCDYISKKDVRPFQLPDEEEDASFKVQGIHLGTYIFWDDERQTEFVRDTYGWRETQIEQAYKCYKSAECMMPGMHDFTCYLKRGYARATMQANIDVRNGLLTREEGFDLIRRVDPIRPEALDYFLSITGMTEEEFHGIMKSQRLEQLRDVDIPVYPKEKPNREKIRPFAVQIIERLKSRKPNPMELDMEAFGQSAEKGGLELPDSFLDVSIREILEGYAAGSLDPVKVADICIRAVKQNEHWVKAWEVFDGDALMEQAKKSEKRIKSGRPWRKLEGIPAGIKDIFNTRDFPTQMGSPIWKGFTPGNDARVVFNLREAGALFPGKTVTAEFAVHTLGKTLNPHDGSRNPGTSSSGSAAAVATGMIPVAMGTQTAASIMRPASFCGVYGCKPSFGLIPRTGILKTTDSLDTVGFFSVFYDDLKRLFDVVTVKGENYPMSHAALGDRSRQEKPADRPWRVAFIKPGVYKEAEDYALESLHGWVNRLGGMLGIEIVESALPNCMNEAHRIHRTIYDKTLSYYFKEEYESASLISPVMNGIIRNGFTIEPEVYKEALREQTVLISEMDNFMKDFDVMVSLATAGEAPLREEVEKPDAGLMWTLTHLPVICAPVFTSPRGLPFGLQIAARKYNDLLLFRFLNELRSLEMIPQKSNPQPPMIRIGT